MPAMTTDHLLYLCFWCFRSIFSVITFSFTSSVFAQQFDQQYLIWKQQQNAHDLRLESTLTHQSAEAVTSKKLEPKQALTTTGLSTASERVNINQANVQQLQKLKGVGEKKALAIIEYRQQYGPFKHIEQLKQVKGIGESIFLKNQTQLAL